MKTRLLSAAIAATLASTPALAQTTDPLATMRGEHVMVTTNQYTDTMNWYQENLGFRLKHEWTVPEFPELQLSYLEKNGYIVEIVASTETPDMQIPDNFAERFTTSGIGHFAFLVDDVDAVAADLKAKNVSMPMPPTSFPDSGRRVMFIEDNNGHVIEFLEELPLNERNAYTGGEKMNNTETITALTQQWLDAWNIGDQPFDATRFQDLFALGDNAIEVFDNVQGDVIVIRDIDTYMQTWTPFMQPLQYWSLRLDDLTVQVSGELALTTFKLVGTDTRGANGEAVPFGQYGTHVWKKLPELGWRIIHEHLTSFDVTKTEGIS